MTDKHGSLEHNESMDHQQPRIPTEFDSMGEHELAAFDRKMLLKLDLTIVPVVATLYLLSFLDRSNIGNARVVRATWCLCIVK